MISRDVSRTWSVSGVHIITQLYCATIKYFQISVRRSHYNSVISATIKYFQISVRRCVLRTWKPLSGTFLWNLEISWDTISTEHAAERVNKSQISHLWSSIFLSNFGWNYIVAIFHRLALWWSHKISNMYYVICMTEHIHG